MHDEKRGILYSKINYISVIAFIPSGAPLQYWLPRGRVNRIFSCSSPSKTSNGQVPDTPMLKQLIYISTARPSLMPTEVEAILQKSRERNQRDKVTGLLVFDGKRFLQAVEGPHAAVEATYARIILDPRHRALVKLSDRDVNKREFGDWSMGSHLSGPVMGAGDLIAHVDAMTEDLSDRNMRETLRSFVRIRSA